MALQLYIVRHAKAANEEHFPGDFYRTLDKKGYAEAQKMASLFSSSKPGLMISSPAVRAFTTCLIFAEYCNYPMDNIAIRKPVYEASWQMVQNVIAETRDVKSLAIFGHNPGLTDLVNVLCGAVLSNLSTAGIAELKLDIRSWSDIDAGCATLVGVTAP